MGAEPLDIEDPTALRRYLAAAGAVRLKPGLRPGCC